MYPLGFIWCVFVERNKINLICIGIFGVAYGINFCSELKKTINAKGPLTAKTTMKMKLFSQEIYWLSSCAEYHKLVNSYVGCICMCTLNFPEQK